MHEDHARARTLARTIDGAGGARVVAPDTNIVMLDLPAGVSASDLARGAAERGVRISPWTPTRIRAVTHLDVNDADIATAGAVIRSLLENGAD